MASSNRPVKKARTTDEVDEAQERLDELVDHNTKVAQRLRHLEVNRPDPAERELECVVCLSTKMISFSDYLTRIEDAIRDRDRASRRLLEKNQFVCSQCMPRCFICGEIIPTLTFLTGEEKPVVTCGAYCAIWITSGADRGSYLYERTLRSRGKLIHHKCKKHFGTKITRNKAPVDCKVCLDMWILYHNLVKGEVTQSEL